MPSISPFFTTRPFRTLVTIAVLMGLVTLSGCSSTTKRHAAVAKSSPLFAKTAKQTSTQKRLAQHFRSWQWAPYRLGGNNKRGVDCSGFVQITYRDVFAKSIPRTTKQLAKVGKTIPQKNLKFGDLVFFKTSRKVRHVGIYIGRGKFIHASTSRGVMQSNLSSIYWKKHYWMAKRIPG